MNTTMEKSEMMENEMEMCMETQMPEMMKANIKLFYILINILFCPKTKWSGGRTIGIKRIASLFEILCFS